MVTILVLVVLVLEFLQLRICQVLEKAKVVGKGKVMGKGKAMEMVVGVLRILVGMNRLVLIRMDMVGTNVIVRLGRKIMKIMTTFVKIAVMMVGNVGRVVGKVVNIVDLSLLVFSMISVDV